MKETNWVWSGLLGGFVFSHLVYTAGVVLWQNQNMSYYEASMLWLLTSILAILIRIGNRGRDL